MIRKVIIAAFVVFLFTACNNSKQANEIQSYNVPELLQNIEENIDKEAYIVGMVNHVCSHSGRRCFLIDESGEHSIRIEATGEIESFSKELIGTNLKVKCLVKEDRLTAEEIEQWEQDVLEKHPEDAEADGETCSAEMSNIREMRAWMKEHNKDYYAIYYAEGLSYEVVEQ